MKKMIAAAAFVAMGAFGYAQGQNWYVGLGYDGVGAKVDLNRDVSLMATYGGLGTLSGFRARGIYKFRHYRDYNLYGFGGFLFDSFDETTTVNGGYGTSATSEVTVDTKGAEFGVGIEYDLRKFMHNDLPIFVSAEIGYRATSTDVEGTTTYDGYYENPVIEGSAEYDYSGFIGGVWFFYRF